MQKETPIPDKVYKEKFNKFCSYANILPPLAGAPIKFELNDVQKQMVRDWHYRSIILKARQVGSTTLSGLESIFFAHECFPNGITGVVFQDADGASFKLREIAEQVERLSPDAGISIDATCNSAEMFRILPSYNTFVIGSGAAKNPLRNKTPQQLLVSEFAHYKYSYESFASFEATIHRGGIIKIESTPCGTGTVFYEMYKQNKYNKTWNEMQYKTLFYPWWKHDEYKSNPPKNMELSEEELQLIRDYDLTLGQIAWRRERLSYPNTTQRLKIIFAQEYPTDDETCWAEVRVSPFNLMKVQKMPTFEPYKIEQNVRLYEMYNPKNKYFMGVDSAKGGNDENSFVVVNQNKEIAAVYNDDIGYTFFADIVHEYSKMYNCLDNIEVNAGWGKFIVDKLSNKNYPVDKINEFNTTKDSRVELVSLVDKWITASDSLTDRELKEAIMWFDKNRKTGSNPHKDDIVMAFGLALYAAEHLSYGSSSFITPNGVEVIRGETSDWREKCLLNQNSL